MAVLWVRAALGVEEAEGVQRVEASPACVSALALAPAALASIVLWRERTGELFLPPSWS